MQTDEEVGKVAAAVPVLISKALEHFIEALLMKASQQTLEKNAKTLTTSHIKQCIHREKTFDFLKDLVENVPDLQSTNEKSNSTTTDSGQHSRAKTTGNKRKRKHDDSASNSFSDEDNSDDEDEDEDDYDDEREESEQKENKHKTQTSSKVQYNFKHREKGPIISSPSTVQSFQQPGPSYTAAAPFMMGTVPQADSMQGFSLHSIQYKPRHSKADVLEDEEDYDA